MKKPLWMALALLVLTACDIMGPDDGRVEIRFRGPGAPANAQIIGTQAGPALAQTITGSNGTLTLESLHLVVGEFELEGSDDACREDKVERDDDDDEGEDDDEDREDCGEFEAAPFLLSLPLDGVAAKPAFTL